MKKITNILLILSVAILLFGSGYKVGEFKTSRTARPSFNILNADKNNTNLDFNLFWETWDKVGQKYVDKKKVDSQKMFYGAIKGMVASLEDPYTIFLTPEENQSAKDDLGGKFEGIGAQLGLKNNRIVVIAPIKSSPAEQAGIKAGDIIAEVDGQSTKNWTLPQAVSKIRGHKGTKVVLTIERGKKTQKISITRDQIHIDSVELSYETQKTCKSNCQKVARIKLNQFGEDTNAEWDRAVQEIDAKIRLGEINGLILDLRDNPGGFLDGAVYLAAEFLPVGRLIVKQESTLEPPKNHYSERRGRLLDIPLVVLINKGSASASEILAGALRDYKRASLIGEKTFGKGSVQEALDLQDGAGLRVTVAKWILPNGDWINSKGIEPHIKVENKIDEQNTLTRDKDAQLERAVEEVLK